jgi:hypothetical protein
MRRLVALVAKLTRVPGLCRSHGEPGNGRWKLARDGPMVAET